MVLNEIKTHIILGVGGLVCWYDMIMSWLIKKHCPYCHYMQEYYVFYVMRFETSICKYILFSVGVIIANFLGRKESVQDSKTPCLYMIRLLVLMM